MRRDRTGGRYADVPGDIPAREWLQITGRVIREFGRHDMTVRAAAISFFGLFSIFSAVGAFVAFYGMFANPYAIVEHMQALSGFVPADVVVSLIGQMRDVSKGSSPVLVSVGSFSLVAAVWSAQQGVAALMIALNVAYLETMPHGPWMHALKSLLMAIGIIIGLLIASVLVIGLPLVAQSMSGWFWLVTLVRIGSMAVAGLILLFGLTALYRWVPDRRPPRWHWVGAGAVLIVGFWSVGSILFSVFLAFSNSYTVMYGSLGAVVTLLTLTYVTVITVLVGAELNAQLEYHTTRDTTVHEARPMGQRGAYVADHVAAGKKRADTTIDRNDQATDGDRLRRRP